MPRRIEKPEISDEAAQLIQDAMPGDPTEREAWLQIRLGMQLAELVSAIPQLAGATVLEYTSAVAAAIAAGAISPDIGRALLYAAQLAIAARAGSGSQARTKPRARKAGSFTPHPSRTPRANAV
jgi:hypothetical protein